MTRASIVVPCRGEAARPPLVLASLQGQTAPMVEMTAAMDGDIDDRVSVERRLLDRPFRDVPHTTVALSLHVSARVPCQRSGR